MKKLLWAIVIALLGLGIAITTAIADDDDDYEDFVPITTCNTGIYESGYYKLTNDLVGCFDVSFAWFRNAITVYANDVTIDLDGHTISCAVIDPTDDTDTIGVFVTSADPPRRNVHVKDGVIENCGDGILTAITNESTFEELTIRDGLFGVFMISGFENRVRKNQISGMREYGIFANNDFDEFASRPSGDHRITKNLIHDVGVGGISVYGIPGSKIMCNRADRNGNTGIAVGFPSTDMDVRKNVANNNAQTGISIYGVNVGTWVWAPVPAGNTVKGNTAVGNIYDLAEASVDFADETFPYLLNDGAECLNKWKGNRYHTQLAPLDCIAPSRRFDDDDDDEGCAPGYDDDDDDDDDEDDDD